MDHIKYSEQDLNIKLEEAKKIHENELQAEIKNIREEVDIIKKKYSDRYIPQAGELKKNYVHNVLKLPTDNTYSLNKIVDMLEISKTAGKNFLYVHKDKLNSDIALDFLEKNYKIVQKNEPAIRKGLNMVAKCIGVGARELIKISWK